MNNNEECANINCKKLYTEHSELKKYDSFSDKKYCPDCIKELQQQEQEIANELYRTGGDMYVYDEEVVRKRNNGRLPEVVVNNKAEERQQLMDLIEVTRGKVSELNTALFSSQDASEHARDEALREVFAILQQAGVDLQDPQSVGDFLAKMREVSPELGQMLEESLEALLTGEAPAPADNTMKYDITRCTSCRNETLTTKPYCLSCGAFSSNQQKNGSYIYEPPRKQAESEHEKAQEVDTMDKEGSEALAKNEIIGLSVLVGLPILLVIGIIVAYAVFYEKPIQKTCKEWGYREKVITTFEGEVVSVDEFDLYCVRY